MPPKLTIGLILSTLILKRNEIIFICNISPNANRLNADYQKTPNEESPKQSTKQYIHDFID